jgi:hypothetical protein
MHDWRTIMKTLAAVALACLMGGCATLDKAPINNSNNPHEDGLATPSPEAGPTLCQDGSVPPCTPRS